MDLSGQAYCVLLSCCVQLSYFHSYCKMSGSSSTQKRSAVWLLMSEIPGDRLHAQCSLCTSKISRGGEKGRTTTNMKNHLMTFHRADYDRAEEETKRKSSSKASASPSAATVDLTGSGSHHRQLTVTVSWQIL